MLGGAAIAEGRDVSDELLICARLASLTVWKWIAVIGHARIRGLRWRVPGGSGVLTHRASGVWVAS